MRILPAVRASRHKFVKASSSVIVPFSPGPSRLSTRLESTSRLVGSASDLARTDFESKSLRRGPPAGREKPAPRIRVVSPGITSQYTQFTEIYLRDQGGPNTGRIE